MCPALALSGKNTFILASSPPNTFERNEYLVSTPSNTLFCDWIVKLMLIVVVVVRRQHEAAAPSRAGCAPCERENLMWRVMSIWSCIFPRPSANPHTPTLVTQPGTHAPSFVPRCREQKSLSTRVSWLTVQSLPHNLITQVGANSRGVCHPHLHPRGIIGKKRRTRQVRANGYQLMMCSKESRD